jgi:type I restriction enzyme, S subunit
MSWVTTKLGDVVTLKRGYDLPSSIRELGDVPVVSSSGVTGQHNVAKVNGPGVVTGRYGTLGEVFFIDKDFWPLNTSLYVQHFKGNVPRFIAYFLRQVLSQLSSDKAAVPGVNRNDLHAKTVRLPDPKIQERIADTLATYDDLIENMYRIRFFGHKFFLSRPR